MLKFAGLGLSTSKRAVSTMKLPAARRALASSTASSAIRDAMAGRRALLWPNADVARPSASAPPVELPGQWRTRWGHPRCLLLSRRRRRAGRRAGVVRLLARLQRAACFPAPASWAHLHGRWRRLTTTAALAGQPAAGTPSRQWLPRLRRPAPPFSPGAHPGRSTSAWAVGLRRCRELDRHAGRLSWQLHPWQTDHTGHGAHCAAVGPSSRPAASPVYLLRFGGTCVGSSERIRNAAKLMTELPSTHKCVVVSAMGTPGKGIPKARGWQAPAGDASCRPWAAQQGSRQAVPVLDPHARLREVCSTSTRR